MFVSQAGARYPKFVRKTCWIGDGGAYNIWRFQTKTRYFLRISFVKWLKLKVPDKCICLVSASHDQICHDEQPSTLTTTIFLDKYVNYINLNLTWCGVQIPYPNIYSCTCEFKLQQHWKFFYLRLIYVFHCCSCVPASAEGHRRASLPSLGNV